MKPDHAQIERQLRTTADDARVAPSARLRIATLQKLTEAAREQPNHAADAGLWTLAGRRWATALAGCAVVAAVVTASIMLNPGRSDDADEAVVVHGSQSTFESPGERTIKPQRVADVARLLISPEIPSLKDAATGPLMREARLIARHAEKSWRNFTDRLPKLPREHNAQRDPASEL